MKNTKNLLWVLLLTFCHTTFAQSQKNLHHQINQIIAQKQATVGVAISDEKGEDTLTINGNKPFPMQSVFKFPVAVKVLQQVDEGHLSLDQQITISKSDLNNDLYSPIRDRYPNGTSLKLSKVFEYAVAQSDNIASDKLLELIGGPSVVEDYIHKQGIQNIAIKYNEEEQQSQWDKQFENWITPKAANKMLELFYKNKDQLFSPQSHAFLWETMKGTTTGQKSIRGELPKETIIAHKTGHSGTNSDGITAAVNDIGIVFLPNGHYFYLSVFVSNSSETDAINQKIIADIAKAAWDHFIKK